jgi:alpha-tubulin suppressor-like RCC1 family protein
MGSATTAAIARITAGNAHTCAVGTAADAYCWGDNNAGAVGDGSVVHRPTPVRIDVQ